MTKSNRHKQRPPRLRRQRTTRRSGNWNQHGREWAWAEHLWRGAVSAWLAFWRWLWRLHIWAVLLATILVACQLLGWIRLLPEASFVPLAQGVLLYWVIAAAVLLLSWVNRGIRVRDYELRLRVRQDLSAYHPVGGKAVDDLDIAGGDGDWGGGGGDGD